MESLTRPFHRRKESFSKKHSNVSSFSEKNAYDDVFSAAAKFGAPAYSSRIEDYKEIFGGSRASSIPILDLPALDEAKATVDARSSNLDYSKIFGGLRDEDIAVPYEEVLANSKGSKSSSGKARTPAKTSSSDGSASSSCYEEEVCQRGAPNQSLEGMKQCNAFYNKTTLGSNDGTNRTIHVAQLRAVPGFTCFIDENLQKREGDKLGLAPKDDVRPFPKVDAELNKKQTPDRTEKSKSQSSWDKFYSIDRIVDANGSSFRTHSFKFSSPTRVHASLASNRGSTSDAYKAGPGDRSPSFSDEDIDVDSAAAASATALRKAVEEAQACIRLAKEMMERNKNASKRFPKPYSKDGLEVKKKREDSIPNLREKNTTEVCKTVDFVVQVITKSEREKARSSKKVPPNLKESEEVFIANKGVGETNGSYFKPCGDCEAQISKPEREKAQRIGKVAPKFTQSEESFIAKHVVGETKGGKSEPSEDCKALKKLPELVNTGEWRTATLESECIADSNIFQSVHAYKSGKKEMQTEEEILEQLDGHGKGVFEETKELNDYEGTPNIVKMAQDGVQCVHDIAQEVHEQDGKEKTTAVQEYEDTEEQKTFSAEEKYEKELVDSVEQSKIADSEFQDVNANNDGELDEAQECLENEKIQQESLIEKEHKFSKGVHEEEESVKHICEQDEIENRLQEACEWRDYEVAFEVKSNESRQNDDEGGERNDKRLDKIHGLDIDKDKQDGFSNLEVSDKRREVDCDWKGKEEILIEACQYEETESIKQETGGNMRTDVFVEASESSMNLDGSDTLEEEASEHLSGCEVAHDNTINFEENERISEDSQSSCDFNVDELGFEEVENLNDVNFEEENMEMSNVLQSCEFNEDMNTEVPYTEGEREMFMTGPLVEDAAEQVKRGHMVTDATRSLLFINPTTYVDLSDTNFEAKQTELNEDESELAYDKRADSKASVSDSGEDKRNPKEERTAFNREEIKPDPSAASVERIWVEVGNRMEASQLPNGFKGEEEKTRGIDEGQRVEMEIRMEASQPCNVFEGEGKLRGIDEEIKTSQNVQNDEANKTSEVEEESTKGTAQKEVESESKQVKGNDETSKRGEREREKDRMVVERAIREARERAFAEARERAERAAVERATAEARQRVMAEARQKFEKANVATKSSAEKASLQAKVRSERAAVERATAEARERALEKALCQKATFPSPKLDGNDGESAQRCKARLERHHRTMERAAKALAEKNMRDLLAQKEQAERHRLAETLDAEVKRWSSGKEGNLRALLSTLQYILGPDSGWHPISLTEIVTTTAVKKAYRKATLHVHPDKLQQRGASIQQKYICEKIFDLLKAAWNRFDSEER